jgi:hypothetical protein
MATTYGALLGAHQIEVPRHLEEDAAIPVLTGLQIQGDVAIIPMRPSVKPAVVVPPAGVPVVRGEAGGNTHLLLGEGGVVWAPVEGLSQDLGVVTVPDGGTAYLLHPEHGANAMGPGAYRLRRQREQRDEIALVAD